MYKFIIRLMVRMAEPVDALLIIVDHLMPVQVPVIEKTKPPTLGRIPAQDFGSCLLVTC